MIALCSKEQRIPQLEKELAEMKSLLNKQQSPVNESAPITIYSAYGGQVRTIELIQRGHGEIEISNKTLSEGVNINHLEIAGTSVDEKKNDCSALAFAVLKNPIGIMFKRKEWLGPTGLFCRIDQH